MDRSWVRTCTQTTTRMPYAEPARRSFQDRGNAGASSADSSPSLRTRVGDMALNGTSTAPTLPVSVVELRRYTLHPGRCDTLIALFESELVDPQEAVGMSVIGQFRDLDAPDSFVWLRGFPDMTARRRSLEAFYGGPVWGRHRDAANATIIDSDDVLLLR